MYSCHLFLISCHFSPLFCSSLHEMVPRYLQILKEISNLSHSIAFLYLFIYLFIFCTVHLRRTSYLSLLFSGTLHSVGFIFPILLCLSILFFSQLFIRPPQTTTLPCYLSFSWGWFWSPPPTHHYEPLSIVLQALCLPVLVPWIYTMTKWGLSQGCKNGSISET